MRYLRIVAICLSFCTISGAQTAFEVATIKTAQTPTAAMVMSGKFHVGLKIDGGRADLRFVTLKDLVSMAYKVKDYQVAGPDWIGSERFDVVGKIPDGVAEDKVPEMIQVLLTERFGLKEHVETRDHPVYLLVQAKGGAKLKESAEAPATPPAPDAPAPKDQTSFSVGTGDGKVTVTAGRGGAVVTTSDGAKIHMGMGSDGAMQMQASRLSMTALAEYLNRMVDRPVFDRTSLKGYYEVSLDLALSDLIKAAATSGVIAPGMGAGAGRGGPLQGAAAPGAASDPAGGSIFSSIQKLGLRLEPTKEPVETIVIDHVEKSPTQN